MSHRGRTKNKRPKNTRQRKTFPKCESSGKTRYTTWAQALNVLIAASRTGKNHKVPVSSYLCPSCKGNRLTSKTPRRLKPKSEKAAL